MIVQTFHESDNAKVIYCSVSSMISSSENDDIYSEYWKKMNDKLDQITQVSQTIVSQNNLLAKDLLKMSERTLSMTDTIGDGSSTDRIRESSEISCESQKDDFLEKFDLLFTKLFQISMHLVKQNTFMVRHLKQLAINEVFHSVSPNAYQDYNLNTELEKWDDLKLTFADLVYASNGLITRNEFLVQQIKRNNSASTLNNDTTTPSSQSNEGEDRLEDVKQTLMWKLKDVFLDFAASCDNLILQNNTLLCRLKEAGYLLVSHSDKDVSNNEIIDFYK
ncbi:hypothetical protein Ddc_06044 [Ditylenchus destructor]|nr:hypothetical protein Ddc_06044 [Ditylenchus destructor]